MPVVTAVANAGWFRRLPPGPRLPSGPDTVLYAFIALHSLAQALLDRSSLFLNFALPRASEFSGRVPAAFAAARSVVAISSVPISDGFHFRVAGMCLATCSDRSGIRCHGTELSMHGCTEHRTTGQLEAPPFQSLSCCSGLHQNCFKF